MRRIVLGALILACAANATASELGDCLVGSDFLRVARVIDPQGQVVYARVVEQHEGHVTRAAKIADGGTSLSSVFESTRPPGDIEFPVSDDQICAVVKLPEADLDAETHVIVSTGLNYAAHAEEAGGGEVFLFPKPAAPTPLSPQQHESGPSDAGMHAISQTSETGQVRPVLGPPAPIGRRLAKYGSDSGKK